MDWFFWILTGIFSIYFVFLLLDFNRPSRKLLEQIRLQEAWRAGMEKQLAEIQQNTVALKAELKEFETQWDQLENCRQELMPKACRRRMVQIPAGPFVMGSREEDSPKSERPAHKVVLSAYYVASFPVTNQEYREFINCTGYKPPAHWQRGSFPTGTARHPVTQVSWHDARDYAKWAGARLPTEAEWEKAARGQDERLYPWGTLFAEAGRCNCANLVGTTLPVDEFPAGRGPYGVWDMAGNVYEWCQDYFSESYYRESPSTDPKGPQTGTERVIRGGCFSETRAGVRVTHRAGAGEPQTRRTIGFRLAMDMEPA